jgi:tetratricopeptide (TPR) repeat protein
MNTTLRDTSLAPHRFRQAQALHLRGKFKEAIAEYEAALAIDPLHADSLHYLALAEHQAGDTQKGLQHIRRALELRPNDLGALTNCGELCRAANMPLEAEVHLNIAAALHPGAAEPRVNLAALYLDQGRQTEAQEMLRQARELQPEGNALMRRLWSVAHAIPPDNTSPRPDMAKVLIMIGRELNARKRPGLALPFLRKALEISPTAVAWMNVGIALYDRDDKYGAIEAFTHAIALDGAMPMAHVNLGNALMEVGDETAAAKAYDAAAALAPNQPFVRFNQSLLGLKKEEWPGAWALYDDRHRLPGAREWPGPRWDGSDINGKRLLVHCEQGAGDTLQFMRFLPLLKRTGAHVVLAAQQNLARLCSRTEGIDDFLKEGLEPVFDFRIELLSLPHIFGATAATLPPPAKGLLVERNHKLAERVAELSGRKIGLCWAGASIHKNDWRRSAPLGLLQRLRDTPDTQWISLQVGARAADIDADGWTGRIHDWTGEIKDFADTAALIEALDLVITVDTAVAHLAATLGKQTWLMLATPGEWRWGTAPETTIWYPTVRLFRQVHPFDWPEVATRVRNALDNRETKRRETKWTSMT